MTESSGRRHRRSTPPWRLCFSIARIAGPFADTAPSLPTLVMVGEQDSPLVGPSHRMAEAIPAGRLAVVPDAGHSPQFENPDAWWDALSTFLRGVPRRRDGPARRYVDGLTVTVMEPPGSRAGVGFTTTPPCEVGVVSSQVLQR